MDRKNTSATFVAFSSRHGRSLCCYHIANFIKTTLNFSSALQFHMQRHTRDSDKKEELLQKETIVDGKVTNNVEASDPNSAEIAQPINKDGDGSTVCSMCDKVFQNLQGYLMHFKDAHKKKRTCVLCNVIFVSKYGIESMHIIFFFMKNCSISANDL